MYLGSEPIMASLYSKNQSWKYWWWWWRDVP